MMDQPDKPKTVKRLKCSVCNSEYSIFRILCPTCFSQNTIRVIEEPIAETSLLEKSPPLPLKRYRAFNGFFDDFIPDGIPEGTVGVITGKPGSRKSFSSLEWASNFVRLDIRCLYSSNEMEPHEIERYIKTLGIQSRLPNIVYQKGDIELHRIIKRERPQVLFLDSYQKLRADSGYDRSPSANDDLVKRINIFAKEYGCIVFVISHKVIPVGLEHDVQIVFKCIPLKNDPNIVKVTTTKNRRANQGEHVVKFFGIDSNGFHEVFWPKSQGGVYEKEN
jgi:predicted ATP-dependent serine protease